MAKSHSMKKSSAELILFGGQFGEEEAAEVDWEGDDNDIVEFSSLICGELVFLFVFYLSFIG